MTDCILINAIIIFIEYSLKYVKDIYVATLNNNNNNLWDTPFK